MEPTTRILIIEGTTRGISGAVNCKSDLAKRSAMVRSCPSWLWVGKLLLENAAPRSGHRT